MPVSNGINVIKIGSVARVIVENKVAPFVRTRCIRWARLVLGWMTAGQSSISSYGKSDSV